MYILEDGVVNEYKVRRCSTCAERIDSRATKCLRCGSYQDFRRYLTMSHGVISSLVALVSVIITGTPFLLRSCAPETADVQASYYTCSQQRIVGILTNTGTRHGILRGAVFGSNSKSAVNTGINAEVRFLEKTNATVRSNTPESQKSSDRIPRNIFIEAQESTIFEALPLRGRFECSTPNSPPTLRLQILNFDHSQIRVEPIECPCQDFQT